MKLRVVTLVMIYAATSSFAAVTVSWPTQGKYRIGQYLAVRIEVPPAKVVEVEAQGLMPLRIVANGSRISGVFPMLVIDRPGDVLTVKVDGAAETIAMSLTEVRDEQRVVGVIGNALTKQTKSITIDANESLQQPAAWDVLDEIVSDGVRPLPEQFVRFMLAKGCAFTVKSTAAPDTFWPWKNQGDVWVLHFEPAGPTEANENAYLPARGWSPGMLKRTRFFAVSFGVMTGILLLGAALLRSAFRTIAMLIIVVIAVMAFSAFARHQPALREARGAVIVQSDELRQTDFYEYQSAVRDTSGVMAFNGLTRPMLISPDQARIWDLRLMCAHDGTPMYFLTKPGRDCVMCWRTRGVNPRSDNVVPSATRDSRLRDLALLYGPVAGEGGAQPHTSDYEEQWGVVIVDRRRELKP